MTDWSLQSDVVPDSRLQAYGAYFEGGSAVQWWGYYEGFLAESSTAFLAGTKTISIADYLLLDLIDTHAQLQPARSEVLFAMFPRIVVLTSA